MSASTAGRRARVGADTPAPGVVVHTLEPGFRYGAEAFWLAGAAMALAPRSAVDVGTGSGVVALLLAARGVDVLGVDAEPAWAEGWQRTLAASRVAGRARLVVQDVRDLTPQDVDVVVMNPPFFAFGTGPMPSGPLRRAARFELRGGLAVLVAAAAAQARPDGALVAVVPVEREAVLVGALPSGWGPCAWWRVGARRAVVVARRGGTAHAPVAVPDDGPLVQSWYAAVNAEPPARVRDC